MKTLLSIALIALCLFSLPVQGQKAFDVVIKGKGEPVLLFPGFNTNLSTAMFWFCVISGSGFLIGFGIFLIHLVRKEIRLLDYLTRITSSNIL